MRRAKGEKWGTQDTGWGEWWGQRLLKKVGMGAPACGSSKWALVPKYVIDCGAM